MTNVIRPRSDVAPYTCWTFSQSVLVGQTVTYSLALMSVQTPAEVGLQGGLAAVAPPAGPAGVPDSLTAGLWTAWPRLDNVIKRGRIYIVY